MNKKNIRSLRKKFKEEDITDEYLEDENIQENLEYD